jgi:hypothetical protein
LQASGHPAVAQDPLPSWDDGAPKKAIVAFVEKVTKEDSLDFVPAAEQIATFDFEQNEARGNHQRSTMTQLSPWKAIVMLATVCTVLARLKQW